MTFNQDEDTCTVCGNCLETIEHIFLECDSTRPGVDAVAVAILEVPRITGNEDNVNASAVESSKKRLKDRWLNSRAVA